jgi:hypothetical protein
LARIKASGDYFTDHFAELPLLMFVFAIDDHGGANICPAIWSAMLASPPTGAGCPRWRAGRSGGSRSAFRTPDRSTPMGPSRK